MNQVLNKYSNYKDISTLFGGLGTLLIDGDALIDYLQSKDENNNYESIATHDHETGSFQNKINEFITKLKNCGFNRIEILCFDQYFTKSELFSRNFLENLFKEQNCVFFENCENDRKWLEYVKNEQICAMLTNVYLLSIEDDHEISVKKNDYISKIMFDQEISIALLDYINFSHSNVHTFLVDYHILLKYELSSEKHDDLFKSSKSETIDFETFDFKLHDLKNSILVRILKNEKNRVVDDQQDNNFDRRHFNFSSIWEIKIDNEDEDDSKGDLSSSKAARKKLIQHQKYYRYMERYSQSLDSSKFLHHKIIINDKEVHEKEKKTNYNQSKASIKQKKPSKADEIIEKNQKAKEAKRAADDLEFIKLLETEIKGFNLEEATSKIDSFINKVNENRSQLFPFYLRNLKYKFFEDYHKTKENISLKLCFLLKEIIENHHDYLISNKCLDVYIKKISSYGFKQTSIFLGKTYLQGFKQNDTIEIESFNNEIYLQLKYNGDKLKRTLNSCVDERVKFKPDEWQVKLLDIVDKNESALVCCPTSAGKTFICYYAMEKILRSDNHSDMIVFVSPNKALANQVAAEIYARFGDIKYPNHLIKSIYAMYMPDYNINDPFNCRILITIPTMLETLLCSKINEPYFGSIKYVIIDELQTINDKDLGLSIEKVINLIDCPILGLSATIANLDEFYNWFNSIEKFKRKQRLHKICHRERYCDLQRFMFLPEEDTDEATELFKSLNEKYAEGDSPSVKDKFSKCFDSKIEPLVPIHEMYAYPISYLKNNDYSFDFHLLPTEIVTILDALDIITDGNEEQTKLVGSIKPNQFFKTTLINKNDVKNYENFLMNNFKEWVLNNVFTKMQIERFYFLLNGKCDAAFETLRKKYGSYTSTDEWVLENIVDLVQSLHEQKMLPAIVFSKSYRYCDELAEKLTTFLEDAQRLNEKDNLPSRKTEKLNKKLKKFSEKKLESYGHANDFSMAEMSEIKDNISGLTNKIEIDDKFTFLNPKYKLKYSEIEEEIELHKKRIVPKIMFQAWKRGIGVHHANFHTKFRSSTEYLFRRQHLQVVFATETLALGINMPCKTVVLLNDAVSFDTMIYRQMVGRAGRRGFDTIGNIVYFGMPKNKIKNFIGSNLINLKGKFTLNLENVLQAAMLNFCDAKNMKYQESTIKYPILLLNSKAQKIHGNDLVKHQINYLIDNGYLNSNFEPNFMANLILPMRQEDCKIFLIAELIRNRFFNKILNYENNNKALEQNCERLILTLCYFTKVTRIDPLLIDLLPKDVVLPRIPELDEFLELNNNKLDAYFDWWFSNGNISNNDLMDKKLYFKEAFPYYDNTSKNSYIYNFYLNGKISTIEENNCVTIIKLWYSVKTFRILLATLVHFVRNYDNDDDLLKVLLHCEKKMKQRFELIVN